MADNDTAALVVALSAQLTRFEKDMKGAVDIADKRTKEIETRFSAMNSAITGKLSELGNIASSQLGFAGTLLRTLGPAGIAAAVGIGTAVGAVLALANATQEFAEKSKRLKEGAETAGLTISQFKLLGQAGKTVGLDFDETTAFFTKFIANIEALRQGGGPLYDALLKIDTGLLRELSTTKDSAQAIDILVAAFKRLEDQTKRLDLARAAGGRAGLSGVRLLDTLGNQGGLAGIQANAPAIDEGQIERAAKLKVEIEAIRSKTANIWGGMFSDKVLQQEKELAEDFQKIAQFIERIVGAKKEAAAVDAASPASIVGANFPPRITVNAKPQAPAEGGATGSPSVELAILQKNLALLGEAVTVGEQWKLKRLEIAAAAEKGGLMDGVAQRALDAFRVTMIVAANATRERLAIATEDQIVQARLAQLSQDATKQKLSENEVQRATVVILREAKEAADALAVRRAYLPGLKQLELDAQNLRKSLDTLAVNSLNNVETALADVVTGTKTAAEAFKAMTNAILSDLARLLIRQSITGPLAGALGGLFGGGGGAIGGGNQGEAIWVGRNAGGTDYWSGGPTWVGERGPELLNLPRGSQIVPNNVATRGGAVNNIQILNQGADVSTGEPQQNQSGGMDLKIMVRKATDENLASGAHDKVMGNRFGVRSRGPRR